MVYSSGNRDYGTAYQPGASGQPSNTENRLPRILFIVVTVLGVTTYGISFGPVGDSGATGWYVRFAVLAGLVAAFGLLPKGKPLPTVTAALAAIGFLDALSSVITASDRGWALTIIVVLNALQAAAAVAALLLGPKADTDTTATAGYEAYVDYYNQAVRNYYSQQAGMSPQQESQRAGYGQAYAEAQAAQHVQPTQRPSQYGDYADLDYSRSRGTTAPERMSGGSVPERPAGLPSAGHGNASADEPRGRTDQSAWPSPPE